MIAPENVTARPRQPHTEVMDVQRGDVWLCQQPITLDEVKAMKVEPPLVKSGVGTGAMDSAHFLRSPGAAEEGPLETRSIDGRSFARVARVRSFGGFPRGRAPTLIEVEKHHVLGFDAGRALNLAKLPDGQFYVEQTESIPGRDFVVPADWQMYTLALDAAWQVQLPCPSRVHFFASLRSFAGPIALDLLPGTPRPA